MCVCVCVRKSRPWTHMPTSAPNVFHKWWSFASVYTQIRPMGFVSSVTVTQAVIWSNRDYQYFGASELLVLCNRHTRSTCFHIRSCPWKVKIVLHCLRLRVMSDTSSKCQFFIVLGGSALVPLLLVGVFQLAPRPPCSSATGAWDLELLRPKVFI